MPRWKRSAECRLCQCPVANAGVRMDKLNSDKLSEWWLQKLGVPLHPEDIPQQWICHFCLLDAKLEHKYSEEKESSEKTEKTCDWWIKFDSNVLFDRNYFQDELIRRCSVVAAVLPEEISRSRSRIASRKIRALVRQVECVYCKVKFPSKSAAYRHAYKDHKDIETAKCKKCTKFFLSKAELLVHKKAMHKYCCMYCDKTFGNSLLFQAHVNSMHEHVKYECTLGDCFPRYFKSKSIYDRHLLRNHVGEYQCLYCKLSYRFKESLRGHIYTKHKEELITCSFSNCAEFFQSENEKLEHEKAVHASRADTIECEICKAKVELPLLNQHMRQFHNCSRTGNGVGYKTTCCYCLKSLPTKAAVVRHVKKVHTNIATFICFNCFICFESLELKREHYTKVHRGNFNCIYCSNFTCTHNSNLIRHMKEKHKGGIKCSYNKKCNLYFKTQDERLKHISETHESDTTDKVRCVYCSKFVTLLRLSNHVKSYHRKIAIRCKSFFCRTYFLTKAEREKHYVVTHKKLKMT